MSGQWTATVCNLNCWVSGKFKAGPLLPSGDLRVALFYARSGSGRRELGASGSRRRPVVGSGSGRGRANWLERRNPHGARKVLHTIMLRGARSPAIKFKFA
jgi:hypothetical protein